MKIVQIAAATAALSVVEAHPSNAKCHATKAYAVGGKIMGDTTIKTGTGQVTGPITKTHTTDPVKLTFASATADGLYWFAQADKGSLAAPTGANCKAVEGCTDTVYCSPGAASSTDLTWTPPADSTALDNSNICVFWGRGNTDVSGECTTLTSAVVPGGVTMNPGMTGMPVDPCANPVFTAEQKTACKAVLEKCKTDTACIQQEMAKLMPTTGPCGDPPAGKQYKNGQTATSVGTSETCFENKQTVEEGSSGATATIAAAGMMAAIAAF